MKLAAVRIVLRELIITLGPALIALLMEMQRQVTSLQQPDWRTLFALVIAQVVTIIARFSVPPSAPAAEPTVRMTVTAGVGSSSSPARSVGPDGNGSATGANEP